MKYASRHGELLLLRFRGGIVVTAETGRVLLLSAGRRAAFWLGLRHERSGAWVTCAALSAVLRRRNNGGVLSWGFCRAKRRLKNGGGICMRLFAVAETCEQQPYTVTAYYVYFVYCVL